MASSKRIFSLDLGTQTVGLAEFQAGKTGGLTLVAYRASGLLADPSADGTRVRQTQMALGELVEGMRARGVTVNYAISAQSVFTRFVKLPVVGEEQVDQIVGFEAQQNVPFPINEVVWDYQLVDAGSAEMEVVLAAVKSDLLEEINGAVESAGLRTGVVDVSPVALYNAYRYNYSNEDGCVLLVDMGARTTNLVFIEGRKVFSRSIPIGGAKITEVIAKDFTENFSEAEERKKRDGFVSLGGAYADPDDADVARVSKMIRNSMTRLHAEIGRSISFYRSQQGGSAPGHVFLCGGSASLPYMKEFFQEKLQVPVEYFNPLRNVAVGPGLNAEEIGRQAYMLGEVVGLALRRIASCPMELDLEPPGVARRKAVARRVPPLVLAVLCVLMALAAGWLYFERAAALAVEMAEKVDQQSLPLKDVERKIAAARKSSKALEDGVVPLLRLAEEREHWVRIINDINSRLTGDLVWLVGFRMESGVADAKPGRQGKSGKSAAKQVTVPHLLLSGLYLSNPADAKVVDDFVGKLNESGLYTVGDGGGRSVPNDAEWAHEFSVPLILKKPDEK